MDGSEENLRQARFLQEYLEKGFPLRKKFESMFQLNGEAFCAYMSDKTRYRLSELTVSLKDKLGEALSGINEGEVDDERNKLFFDFLKRSHSVLCELIEKFNYSKPAPWQLLQQYNDWRFAQKAKSAYKKFEQSESEIRQQIALEEEVNAQLKDVISYTLENIPTVQDYFRRIGIAAIELAKEVGIDPLRGVKTKAFRDDAYKSAMGSKEEAVEAEKLRQSVLERNGTLWHSVVYKFYKKGLLKYVPKFIEKLDITAIVPEKYFFLTTGVESHSFKLQQQTLKEVSQKCLEYRLVRAERIFS